MYMNKSGYVYKVTNLETGEFYIGNRAFSQSSGIIDIGDTYFTSSSNLKFVEDFTNNPQQFSTAILYTGENFLEEKYLSIKSHGTAKTNTLSLNLKNFAPKFSGFGKVGILNHLFGKKLTTQSEERKSRIQSRLTRAKKIKNRSAVRLNNLIIKTQDKAEIKLAELNKQIKELQKSKGKLYKIMNKVESCTELKEVKQMFFSI